MLSKDTEGGSVDTYKDLHTMQCVTAEPWTQKAETPRSSPHSVLDQPCDPQSGQFIHQKWSSVFPTSLPPGTVLRMRLEYVLFTPRLTNESIRLPFQLAKQI